MMPPLKTMQHENLASSIKYSVERSSSMQINDHMCPPIIFSDVLAMVICQRIYIYIFCVDYVEFNSYQSLTPL